MTSPKHVHFIGICGVGTSALAIALHNAGFKVTGSDKGFFPPVSTALTSAGIEYYAGWHPLKMSEKNMPNFIVAGGIGTSSQNPEIIFAKENKIPILSFAEAVGKHIVKKNSIVCTGTWGKTTSSALLSHILENGKMDPSYFYGGVAVSRPSGAIRESDWSVVEGDEYKSAIWDENPKFSHYKPTHLLLSAIKWDHADMYPTEESYVDAFRTLIKSIPKSGTIVYCSDQLPVSDLIRNLKLEIRNLVTYGSNPESLYRYENITQTPEGLTFDIIYHGKTYNIKSPMLGTYNVENITGCFAMAHSVGIAPGDITDAIKTFSGMKRRLEKRLEHRVTVIDDIAHSPEKAKSVLKTIREIYKGKVIAVFEPNSGNRAVQSKPAYTKAFRDADEVLIPHLTKLKSPVASYPTYASPSPKATDEHSKASAGKQVSKLPSGMMSGDELRQTIAETHNNVFYVEDDNKLVEHITADRGDGDVIVFLGSHGFRGMIEETVKKLAMNN